MCMNIFIFILQQRCVKWTAAAMASVMAVCVGVRRAGLELCVTRRPATHCAARMECVRRGSVSVTRDGLGSTAISVSGSNTHTHTTEKKYNKGKWDCDWDVTQYAQTCTWNLTQPTHLLLFDSLSLVPRILYNEFCLENHACAQNTKYKNTTMFYFWVAWFL